MRVDLQIEEAHWSQPDLEITFKKGHSPFGEWTTARWLGGGNWAVLMGSSWEEHYSYSSEEDDLLCEAAELGCLLAGDELPPFTKDERFYLKFLLRSMKKRCEEEGEELSPTWASILKKLEGER